MSELTRNLRYAAMSQEMHTRLLMNQAAAHIEVLEAKGKILDEIRENADGDLEMMCDRCRYTLELTQEELDDQCSCCPVTMLAKRLGI